MPPLQLAPGILRVVFNGLLAGQPTANVMHWARNTAPGTAYTQAQADAVASGLRTAWQLQFNSRQSSADWLLGNVTAQDLTTNLGVVGNAPGSSPGSRAGGSLPANCAMCVSWTVSMHYRGGHGRTYLAGLVSTDQQGATSWATASITAMLTVAQNFLTAGNATFGGVGGQLCILRRTENGATLTPPQGLIITGVTIDTRIDSMRRRLGPDR